MVLDISCFRASDDPDAIGPEQVRAGQRARFKDEGLVDQVIAADEAWRKFQFKADCLKRLKNLAPRKIGARMKAKDPGSPDATLPEGTTAGLIEKSMSKAENAEINAVLDPLGVAQLKALVDELKQMEATNKVDTAKALEDRQTYLRSIGNLVVPSVPVFEHEVDEATGITNNVIERTIGPVNADFRRQYSHMDLLSMIDGVNYTKGAEISGARGYFLKGPGVALEQACMAFSHAFLCSRGSTFLSPPVFMNKEVMSEVAQLSQFDDELYKVVGKRGESGSAEDQEEDVKYLIATGEQPIAAYHRHERLKDKDLPKKYAGMSECFRQEVGSAGRDTKGIFRVHQFKKVEQFAITAPDDSWRQFEEMIANAEGFCQALGLSYQVVNIVSGDLNLAAAKKFDLEAWFPGQGTFRELVSCSNCTDYQAVSLNIRYDAKKQATDPASDQSSFVHMLNSTLCASTRVICCILESYQVGDFESGGGIVVPEALRPFMPKCGPTPHSADGGAVDMKGVWTNEFIPFVKPAEKPAEEKPAKKAGGKKKGGGGGGGGGGKKKK